MRAGVKHTLSSLPDLVFESEVDHVRHIVQLKVARFDSYCIAAHVIGLEKEGVVAYADDNAKNELWLTPRPPYSVTVDLAGVAYGCRVVKLVSGSAAVTLEPPA